MKAIIANIVRGGKSLSYLLAAIFTLAAAPSAQAAAYWTGNSTGGLTSKDNYQSNNNTWSIRFNTGWLTGNKRVSLWIKNDVQRFKLGDSSAVYKALSFQNGTGWEFHTNFDGVTNTAQFDNSGGTDSSNDKDRIAIAANYDGTSTGADAALKLFDIKVKTKYLYVGSSGGAGTLTVQKNAGHDMTLTTTSNMYLQRGSIVCVNDPTISCGGDLILGAGGAATLTINGGSFEVASGKWTKSAGGAGTINLDGGTFTTYHIKDESGSLTVNFNGGTLRPQSTGVRQSELMAHGNGTGLYVNVDENGGTIDTRGFGFSVGVAVNAVSGTTGAFTVTGGGSVTFPEMGSLAGALAVGDNTTLHWFDQDATVSTTCAFTSLALGAGSTLHIDGDATTLDALPATVTTTATAESKATVEIAFSAIPAPGTSFALFPAASADAFDVMPRLNGLELPHETAIENGSLVLTITAEDYTWNGTQTNWGNAGAWTKGGSSATWADGNNAIFNTANATAALAADASPAELRFAADAEVSGSATLTVPSVSVASGVTGTIGASTAGALQKTGAGTLTLGSSRADQTTLSEGTLAMADGATVDASKLTLGTDAAKPVVFDYGGQTLTANPTAYLATGMDITLTNGTFYCSEIVNFQNDTALPAVLTVAKAATLQTSQRWGFNYNGDGLAGVLNVRGGTVQSVATVDNYIMQKSYSGRLDINVTDEGLLEFGGETYMLTCRDNDDAYESPELHVRVVDSTFRVKNGKSVRFGLDGNTKASATPVFTLAATNSVFDIGYAIYLGNDKTGLAKEGSYTAEFNNCVVTAKQVRVYGDRPLNNALFDGSTIAFNAAGTVFAPDADAKWITVATGGLTLDTNGKEVSLAANLGGAGAVTKKGSGTLTVATNQTSEGAFSLNEGTLAFANTCTTFSRALSTAAGTTIDIAGGEPVALVSLTLPAEGTVALTKGGAAFPTGVYQIFSGISAPTVQDKLVPSTGDTSYAWSVENGILLLNVGGLVGNAWTGFAGDGLMSTDGNWLDGTAPLAGETIEFSGVASATEITADIDATFGAVTMGAGVITFKGDKMRATSFTDTSKIAVGENSKVTLAGDLAIQDQPTSYILNKVDSGGAFVVTGKITSTGKNIEVVNVAGDGYIVAGGLEINDSGSDCWLYTTKDGTSQHWAVGSLGITGSDNGGIWCRSNKANDCYIHPYDSDFTVSAWTVVRDAIDHHELNTTGYGDGRPHVITLNAGFADTGALYIAGAGKVVVNHTPAAFGGEAAHSGPVTVQDTATLAINAGKKLTTGKTTFAAGTTLEVPSTGVDMGAIAFSGEGTVTLKVSDATLVDGEYTLVTSTSDLPADVATRFAVSANTASETCLVADSRALRLLVGSRESAGLCVWTGKAGDGIAGTEGNWLAKAKPTAGADVFIAAGGTIGSVPAGFAPASITFGYGIGAVTIDGENDITGVTAITNLSSVSHTINVPVRFAGDIQVKQAAMAEVGDLTKAHITFAGGAYAAEGYAIENANSAAVYSRCMFGKYYLAPSANSPWTATVQGTNKRICLADGSTLYIPHAGSLKELYVGNGAKVDVGSMEIDGTGRVSYKNYGEMAVTNLTVSGSGDRYMSYNQGTSTPGVFKFESLTNSMTGNWFYLADNNAAAKHTIYIGEGGLNFLNDSGSAAYCFGRNSDGNSETIRPWYSDFTIGARSTDVHGLAFYRDVTFLTDDENNIGRTITIDAKTRAYDSTAITVDGSGKLRVNNSCNNYAEPTVAVMGTATLAYKPGASLGTGATTVASGATLEVAESGTVALGGDLTLADGATLKFTFTERRNPPVLNLTGKNVTFGDQKEIKVTLSGERPAYGSDGRYFLTEGGGFSDEEIQIAAAEQPKWVKAIGLYEGNIYAEVYPAGTMILFR